MSLTMNDIKCENYKNCGFCNRCLTSINTKKRRCFKEKKEMTTKEELLKQQKEIEKQLAEIEEAEKKQVETEKAEQENQKRNQLNAITNAITAFNKQWGETYSITKIVRAEDYFKRFWW